MTTAVVQPVLTVRPRSPLDSVGPISDNDYKHLGSSINSTSHHHSSLGIQLPMPASSSQSPMTRHHYPQQQSQQQSHIQPSQSQVIKVETHDGHSQYSQSATTSTASVANSVSTAATVAGSHYPSSRQSPASHSQPLTPQPQHQQSIHPSQAALHSSQSIHPSQAVHSSQPPSQHQQTAYGHPGLHHASMPYFASSYDHYQPAGQPSMQSMSRSYGAPIYSSHPGSIASSLPSLPSQDDGSHQTGPSGAFPPTMYYGVPQNQAPSQPYGMNGSAYNPMSMRHVPVTTAGQGAGMNGGFLAQQSIYHQNSNALPTANASTASSNSTTPSAVSAPSRLGSAQTTPTLPLQMPQNAAPGPIPATTPLVVRQDQNGVQWIAFEYSRDRVKMEYTIRCDVESINVENLDAVFKTENCVYPRACVSKDQYKGNRLHYETECNTVGWALAELNPALRGKRGLIQRAVDSWRNSNQDPRLRSRRVRRMAKNIQRQSESRKSQGDAQQLGIPIGGPHQQQHPSIHPAHRLSLPGMPGVPMFQQSGNGGYGPQSGYSGMAGMGVPSSGPSHHHTAGVLPSVSSGMRPLGSSLGSFPAVSGPGGLPVPARHGVDTGMFTRS